MVYYSILAAINEHDGSIGILTAINAFRKTGIRPLNPEVLKGSPYVQDQIRTGTAGGNAHGFNINAQVITKRTAQELYDHLIRRGRRNPT